MRPIDYKLWPWVSRTTWYVAFLCVLLAVDVAQLAIPEAGIPIADVVAQSDLRGLAVIALDVVVLMAAIAVIGSRWRFLVWRNITASGRRAAPEIDDILRSLYKTRRRLLDRRRRGLSTPTDDLIFAQVNRDIDVWELAEESTRS